MDDASITLILGGARSGKSALAERLAGESGRPVLYLATATAFDAEMAARIAAHRADRPPDWRTAEAPLRLAAAMCDHARPGDLVLLDCLTVWLGNRLVDGVGPDRDPADVSAAEWEVMETAALVEADALLVDARARGIALLLVSNEVGMGVVPAFPLGRRYRDALGRLNQAVAAQADAVLLTIAGLALDLRQLALAPPAPFAADGRGGAAGDGDRDGDGDGAPTGNDASPDAPPQVATPRPVATRRPRARRRRGRGSISTPGNRRRQPRSRSRPSATIASPKPSRRR